MISSKSWKISTLSNVGWISIKKYVKEAHGVCVCVCLYGYVFANVIFEISLDQVHALRMTKSKINIIHEIRMCCVLIYL